jgi:hypothetical protein
MGLHEWGSCELSSGGNSSVTGNLGLGHLGCMPLYLCPPSPCGPFSAAQCNTGNQSNTGQNILENQPRLQLDSSQFQSKSSYKISFPRQPKWEGSRIVWFHFAHRHLKNVVVTQCLAVLLWINICKIYNKSVSKTYHYYWKLSTLCVCVCVCSIEDQTQDLTYVRQAVYHWAILPTPCL